MRNRMDAKTFVQALNKVSGLIQKSSIPALNGVLIQFEPDSCTLTSTNLESWLSIKLPAQGERFSCLLSRPKQTALAFRDFDGELVLDQSGNNERQKRTFLLALTCGSRSAALPVFPPEDFPEQANWETEHTFTANAANLYARVKRVGYATVPPSSEEYRACRTNIEFSGNRIYAVDGYRMAWDVDEGLAVPVPFMASPAALDHLKLFGDKQVTFHLGHLWARVTDGMTALTFRLAEGDLFEPSKVIPGSFQTEFYVSPKEFLGELAYLDRALRGKAPCPIQFIGGRLCAVTQGEQYATKIEAGGSESVVFGFNLGFMRDALEQFKQEPLVKLKCGSRVSPIVIEADGRSDYALVLPVRIRDSSMAA